MPFNSSLYLVLLVVAVVVFWLLPERFRRFFVLAASVAFYATWGVLFVWLPLLVAAIVYVAGKRIGAGRGTASAKQWMRLGIGTVLSLLIVFKYRSFLLANAAALLAPFGVHSVSLATAIAFPIGISFYTFEAIAYLIDVRQGRVKLPGFLNLGLFFFFWPNILSGPIVRARELIPQLDFGKRFAPQFVFDGLDRVIWGLVQKNVIANMLGIWVDKGFAPSAGRPTSLDGWCLAIAFGLQIYFDFAGYTNLAIGTARLLGVTLPENFRFPYHAATPQDFWARWHMTLSRWIRDYLFFPINARWHGAVPLYMTLVWVMGLVGLWHGAGWNFILWGLLHGTYLVAYRVFESWNAGRPGIDESGIVNAAWRLLTLLGVAIAWVVFRASTWAKAQLILSSMFYRVSRGASYSHLFYAWTLLVLLLCAVEPWIVRELNEFEATAGERGLFVYRSVGRPIIYLCGLLLFLLFEENNVQFIYSQF
jgi:alginate O-acetyltransferase complex protein AlgI